MNPYQKQSKLKARQSDLGKNQKPELWYTKTFKTGEINFGHEMFTSDCPRAGGDYLSANFNEASVSNIPRTHGKIYPMYRPK